MVDMFHTAEDLESVDNLHALCNLMQTICAFCRESVLHNFSNDEFFQ